MKKIFAFAVSIFLLSSPLGSQTPKACQSISSPDDRLACYDALYKTVNSPKSEGDWDTQITRSAFDDSTTVTLKLSSLNLISGRLSEEGPAHMFIRCEEGETNLFFAFNGLFMASVGNYGVVNYRIDDNRSRSLHLRESTSNDALGIWNSASIGLTRRLFNAETLTIRATPFNKNRVEATFNIQGLREAIQPLRDACGW